MLVVGEKEWENQGLRLKACVYVSVSLVSTQVS